MLHQQTRKTDNKGRIVATEANCTSSRREIRSVAERICRLLRFELEKRGVVRWSGKRMEEKVGAALLAGAPAGGARSRPAPDLVRRRRLSHGCPVDPPMTVSAKITALGGSSSENSPTLFTTPVNSVGRSVKSLKRWSRRVESNHRPAVYETAALPTELRRLS